MNYRMIAIQVGDLLKYNTTFKEINRTANSVFNFSKEDFPNENITSVRAQLIHDWILTLAKQKMNNDERNELLWKFLHLITPSNLLSDSILKEAGIKIYLDEALNEFYSRNFHPLIHKHCIPLLIALFELYIPHGSDKTLPVQVLFSVDNSKREC